jgi:hypothetical protein
MNVIAPITSAAFCSAFCAFSCIFCCNEYKPSSETREETHPISTVYQTPKENSSVVGEDLASENIECSICLERYEVGQKISILRCMHFYHMACLNTWIRDHTECPQCRENINVVVID